MIHMCEWTWYRCLRPNQVGGWEPSSHHLSPFFCWFTTWPDRSTSVKALWAGSLKNMLEMDVLICILCCIYLENSLPWVQSMLMWVSWTLHCITRLQRVGSILCSVLFLKLHKMDSSLLSVPLACYVYGHMVLVFFLKIKDGRMVLVIVVACGISTVVYLWVLALWLDLFNCRSFVWALCVVDTCPAVSGQTNPDGRNDNVVAPWTTCIITFVRSTIWLKI